MPTLAVSRSTSRPDSRLADLPPEHGLGFFLFLLVNLALFVRPADFIPDFYGLEIYQYLILACLAVSFPAVLARLTPAALEKSPIAACVLLWLPFVALSLLVQSRMTEAWEESFQYFKVIIYFLLLISLVTTPRRLRIFTSCLIVYTTVMTILSVLDFYKVIQLPRPEPKIGERVFIDPNRMYGPGIFADPNDVCIIIVASLMLLLGKLGDKREPRLLWILPLLIFCFGFTLTQSRGGLLALLVGGVVMVRLKWGWGRVFFLGALVLPVLAVVLGARQLAISSSAETGQGRIELWYEGLVMFRGSPLFGVGMNRYDEHAGHVAHNSFMQAFGDTGFFGGMLFLGMVLYAVGPLYRLTVPRRVGRGLIAPEIVDPDYRQIHPYLAGAVAVCAAGMMTLSMNTLATTYTFLGLASVFLDRAETRPPAETRKFEAGLVVQLAALSVAFLLAMFLFVRVTLRN